jgi:hypothetical protein
VSKVKKTIVVALAILSFGVAAAPASAAGGAAWDPLPQLYPDGADAIGCC